jgi:hypothetical protein
LNGLSLSRVAKELAAVKLLCSSKATEIKFKRVYIPKSDDPADERKRPLGVPSPEWRIYLHMYNNLLVWARTGQEGSQHAYFPKRGVITAWRDVFRKISAPNIMEYDLKGFFDNVPLEVIRTACLEELRMPKAEANFLRRMCRSIPQIIDPGSRRSSITEENIKAEPDLGVSYRADLTHNPNFALEQEKLEPSPIHRLVAATEGGALSLEQTLILDREIEMMLADVATYPEEERAARMDEYIDVLSDQEMDYAIMKILGSPTPVSSPQAKKLVVSEETKLETSMREGIVKAVNELEVPVFDSTASPGWHEVGVPQGAPISCSVSTLALSEALLKRQKEFSGYADDGLWFNPSHPESLEKSCESLAKFTGGVSINKEKSKMLKKDGKWLVESFKYLGLRYFPAAPGFWGKYGCVFSSAENFAQKFGKDVPFKESYFETFVLVLSLLLAANLWCYELIGNGKSGLFINLILWGVMTLILSEAFIVASPKLPSPERLRANTRKGVTLEFTVREQFLQWLLLQRQRWISEWDGSAAGKYTSPASSPKFEGSASRLNNWIPESARTWIFWEYLQFVKSSVGPRILFRGKFSGYFLSRLYLDTWNYSVSQDFTLNPMRGSWVKVWWLRYRMQNRGDLNLSQLALVTSLGDKVLKLSKETESLVKEAAPLLRKVWALDALFRQKYKDIAHSSLDSGGVASSLHGSLLEHKWGKLKFPEDKIPIPDWNLEFILEGADAIWNFLSPSKKAKKILKSSQHTKDQKRIYNILKEMSKKSLYFRDRAFWLLNLGQVQLNIFNCSSFAVDSMLRDYPWPKPFVRYYDPVKERLPDSPEKRLEDLKKKSLIAYFAAKILEAERPEDILILSSFISASFIGKCEAFMLRMWNDPRGTVLNCAKFFDTLISSFVEFRNNCLKTFFNLKLFRDISKISKILSKKIGILNIKIRTLKNKIERQIRRFRRTFRKWAEVISLLDKLIIIYLICINYFWIINIILNKEINWASLDSTLANASLNPEEAYSVRTLEEVFQLNTEGSEERSEKDTQVQLSEGLKPNSVRVERYIVGWLALAIVLDILRSF